MSNPKYIRADLAHSAPHAIEEAGEFIQAAAKALRWGWDSTNPELPPGQRETNEAWVRREMADLRQALNRLETALDEERGS